MPQECEKCKRLFDEVESHLNHISEVSKEQAAAVARKDEAWVDRLDHELERTVGAKERSLGRSKTIGTNTSINRSAAALFITRCSPCGILVAS